MQKVSERWVVERVVRSAEWYGWRYWTEVVIPNWGRIDVLLDAPDGLWIVEAKSEILTRRDLRRGLLQVHGYGVHVRHSRLVLIAAWFDTSLPSWGPLLGVEVIGRSQLRRAMSESIRDARRGLEPAAFPPFTEVNVASCSDRRGVASMMERLGGFYDVNTKSWSVTDEIGWEDRRILERAGASIQEAVGS